MFNTVLTPVQALAKSPSPKHGLYTESEKAVRKQLTGILTSARTIGSFLKSIEKDLDPDVTAFLKKKITGALPKSSASLWSMILPEANAGALGIVAGLAIVGFASFQYIAHVVKCTFFGSAI